MAASSTCQPSRTGTYDFLHIDRLRWCAATSIDAIAAGLLDDLRARGARRPFVLASRSLNTQTDVVADLRRSLEATGSARVSGVFDATVPHVSRPSVLECIEHVRSAEADAIISIGGGTVIDTAKMVVLGLSVGLVDDLGFDSAQVRTDAEGIREEQQFPPPPLRQICLPTTLSGAEFSDLAGCVDPNTRAKQLFTAPEIGGSSVMLAPALTIHTPEWLWLSTGVRSVDHAVETICSSSPTPFTTATALHSLTLLAQSLRSTKADPTDLDARLDSQFGVWLACTGLNRVPWGASHGIGHLLGGVAGVAHGFCSCVMLPHVLRYNQDVNRLQQDAISVALGAPGQQAADAIAQLVHDLGLPSRLRDVGVTPEQLPSIAQLSLNNMFVKQNPRRISTADDVMTILEVAY